MLSRINSTNSNQSAARSATVSANATTTAKYNESNAAELRAIMIDAIGGQQTVSLPLQATITIKIDDWTERSADEKISPSFVSSFLPVGNSPLIMDMAPVQIENDTMTPRPRSSSRENVSLAGSWTTPDDLAINRLTLRTAEIEGIMSNTNVELPTSSHLWNSARDDDPTLPSLDQWGSGTNDPLLPRFS